MRFRALTSSLGELIEDQIRSIVHKLRHIYIQITTTFRTEN